MFDIFERKRLVKRGLASAKLRRRRTESELLESFEHGMWMKMLLFAAFVIGLWALIYSDYRQQPMEKVFIGVLIFAVALSQLWINHPNTWDSNSRLALIFGVVVTIGLGVALMVLVFFSSRSERDEAVYHVGRHDHPQE